MGDGAHMNIGAEESMKGVLGSGNPNPMSREDFVAMIRSAPTLPGDQEFDYDTCSIACAKLVLNAYEKYPDLQTIPIEARYLRFADGKSDFDNFYPIDMTLYDVMRRLYDDDSDEYKFVFAPLSGFMWGWAVNAARHVLDLNSVPNPALVEL